MPPNRIMIVRHGEKPPKDGAAPHGVTPDGEHDEDSLVVRGWQRAGALVGLFAPRDGAPAPAGLARPTAILAAGVGGRATSLRSQETVAPVAARLGLSVDARFAPKHYADAAAAIARLDGPVLVAWEHKRIARLVTAIAGAGVAPPYWPGERFDVVLVLDRRGGAYALSQVPQMLLAGDSDAPLPAAGPGEADDEDDG